MVNDENCVNSQKANIQQFLIGPPVTVLFSNVSFQIRNPFLLSYPNGSNSSI